MWRLSSPVIPAIAFALYRPEVVSRSLRSGSSPSFVAESANAVLLEPCDCAEAFPLQAAKTHTERTRSRMIEACRFHNRARRLQPMPLKATRIMIAVMRPQRANPDCSFAGAFLAARRPVSSRATSEERDIFGQGSAL